jgi:hypothetical protein
LPFFVVKPIRCQQLTQSNSHANKAPVANLAKVAVKALLSASGFSSNERPFIHFRS